MNNADDRPAVGRDWIAFVVAWIPYSLLTYRFWHNIDDAFISFRYAKNWAMGYGPRYNLGLQQPEEGYSNFLWVVVCTFIEYLELDITFWAPMLGFVCGSLLLYLVFRTLRRDFDMGLGVAFSITLGLGLFPPYALWSTGGLGTMAFALSIFATAYFLVLRPAGIAPYRGALAGVATTLLRTEGIAWSLLIALLGIVTRRLRGEAVWRPVAVYVAIVGTAFSVYFAWRYSYYQLLFPNPVYAKVGFSPEVALRGFPYVAAFVLTFVTPLLLLPAAGYVAWREAPKPVGLVLGTLSLAFPAYAVMVGGDWMAMGRFLVPGFAFGALLMGWLVTRLWERLTSRLVVMAVVITTITMGLLPAWNVHLVPASVRRVFNFRFSWPYRTEYEMWERNFINGFEDRKEEALALKARFKPGDSIVAGGIGVLGYYSGMHVYDRYGLVDRRVAMLPRQPSRLDSPGHDRKVYTDFFLADVPTVLIYGRLDGPPPSRKNPEYPLLLRIRMKAESWRKLSVWRRYVPEVLPLEPSQQGSPNVLMVLRLIEEKPRIATLSSPQRRAERAWDDFFRELDSALPFVVLAYTSGWYPKETAPESTGRWTHQTATLSFFNPQADATFSLDYAARAPQTVTVSVGDQLLQSFVADASGRRRHHRIPLPATALGNGDRAKIQITVDRTFVPANLIAGSRDTRELGIKVYHAAVERDPVPQLPDTPE